MPKKAKSRSQALAHRSAHQGKTFLTRSQWIYILWVGWFYLALYCYSWNPTWCQRVFGFQGTTLPIVILSLSALVSLLLFFWSTISSASTQYWQRLTWLNAILVSIPCYFLWLRFIL